MSKNLLFLSLVFILVAAFVVTSQAVDYKWYYATNSAEFFYTTDSAAGSFTQTSNPGYYSRGLTVSNDGTIYFACEESNGRILKSTNNGSSWTFVGNCGYYPRGIVAALDGNLYVARQDGYCMKSTDNGASWSNVGSMGYTPRGITSDRNNYLYSGAETDGTGKVIKSTNNGASWSMMGNSFPNWYGQANMGFIGTMNIEYYDGIVCDNNNYVYTMSENDYGKIYYSTNGGSSWSERYALNGDPRGIGAQKNGYFLVSKTADGLATGTARLWYGTSSAGSFTQCPGSSMGTRWAYQIEGWPRTDLPPSSTVSAPASGATVNNNQVLITWAFSDPDGNSQDYYEVNIGSSPGASDGWASGQVNSSATSVRSSALSADQTWYVRVKVRDNSGMWGNWSPNISFTLNTKVSCSAPAAGTVTNNNKVTISWSFPSGDGQDMYEIKIGSSAGAQNGWYSGQVSSSATTVTSGAVPADGVWYIQVRNRKSGSSSFGQWMTSAINVQTWTQVHITLNAMTTPTNDITLAGSGTATVGPPGVVHVEEVLFRVDSGAWFEATPSDGTFNADIENYTFTTFPLLDGVHLIQTKAIDSSVNESPTYGSATVTVDTKEPNSEINPITSPTNINPPTITGTATD